MVSLGWTPGCQNLFLPVSMPWVHDHTLSFQPFTIFTDLQDQPNNFALAETKGYEGLRGKITLKWT